MSIKMQVRKIWDGPSKLGDKLGLDWLTYNPGVFFEFAMVARRNAPIFCEELMASFPDVDSFCDVGCGTGQFSAFLQKSGKKVKGYEYSWMGRFWSRCLDVECAPFDLSCSRPIASSLAGLAFSLEVGEHVPPKLANKFVEFLCAQAPLVVVTCAPPGQSGNGHINCQNKDYWRDLFNANNFQTWRDKETEMALKLSRHSRISPFLVNNLMIFKSNDV